MTCKGVSLEDLKITTPNIFYRGTKSYDENGIFSERIFGPCKNFKCKCGKLNSQVLDDGKRCDKCHVLCVSSEMRLDSYGIIDLPFPCLKPTMQDTRLKEVVVNISDFKKTLLNPIRADYNISQSKYLGIDKSNHAIRLFTDRADKNFIYIPIRITGLYSFILCLKYLAEVFKFKEVKKLFDDQVIMSYLKVIPPSLRPVTFNRDKNNKIQLSEINSTYISILNLNKHNILLKDNLAIDEDDWFERITLYFQGDYDNSDEEIVEHAIIEYDTTAALYQFRIDSVYQTLMSTISGKQGFIRNSMLGKTIEFSARSVICCDPSLEPYQIGVSKKILYKLWMPYFIHYLTKYNKDDEVWCFSNIAIKDYEDNKVLFDKFLRWMYADD